MVGGEPRLWDPPSRPFLVLLPRLEPNWWDENCWLGAPASAPGPQSVELHAGKGLEGGKGQDFGSWFTTRLFGACLGLPLQTWSATWVGTLFPTFKTQWQSKHASSLPRQYQRWVLDTPSSCGGITAGLCLQGSPINILNLSRLYVCSRYNPQVRQDAVAFSLLREPCQQWPCWALSCPSTSCRSRSFLLVPPSDPFR